MVTTPGKTKLPPAAEPLKSARKMEAPELATQAPYNPKYNAKPNPDPMKTQRDLANADRGAVGNLPEKVSQSSIRDQSFRYGGGRSAGNRSIAENMERKVTEK